MIHSPFLFRKRAQLHASATSLYEAIAAGRLVARKRGRRTIILAEDLRKWLDAMPAVVPANTPTSELRSASRE